MLTVSTFSLLHEKNNFASKCFVIISYYRFTYEIHKRLYVHPHAMHMIYKAWIFSTIGFTQSVNMYKTTDTDCPPIWQISARYRLSVNHYLRLQVITTDQAQFWSRLNFHTLLFSCRLMFCFLSFRGIKFCRFFRVFSMFAGRLTMNLGICKFYKLFWPEYSGVASPTI